MQTKPLRSLSEGESAHRPETNGVQKEREGKRARGREAGSLRTERAKMAVQLLKVA